MKNKKKIPVSVVIPAYNCSSTIVDAIESIFCQTVLPLEVIVVDDFSNDCTVEVVREFQNKCGNDCVKIVQLNSNVGAGEARNVGWDLALGDYIAFLDADDTWNELKLEIQWDYMAKNPHIVLCGHDFIFSWQKNAEFGNKCIVKSMEITREKILLKNPFVTPSVMIKKNIPLRFDAGKRYCEDYLLWMKIVLNGYPCFKLNCKLANLNKHQFGERGLSSNMLKMAIGDFENYIILYRGGLLSLISTVLFGVFSFIKFLRRLFIYFGRKGMGVLFVLRRSGS